MDLFKKIEGTGLQGGIYATYDQLVKEFGEPNITWDYPDKVDAQWVLDTPFGVATIYNYKDGHAYLGNEGLDVKDITNWHIGGHTVQVLSWVKNRLLTAVSRFEIKVLGPLGWDMEYYETFEDASDRALALEEEEEEYKVYFKMADGVKHKIKFEL